jgi:tRNA A37 N6-isopentenylltransferase MiaA
LPSDLTELQRAKAIELIRDNRDIFSKHEFDLGLTNLVHHRIDTGQAKPRAERLRHHPRASLDLIDEQADKMLSAGLIEEAASPWAANIVLIPRPDCHPASDNRFPPTQSPYI